MLTGVYTAVVVDDADPTRRRRVRVRVPQVSGYAVSGWVLPAGHGYARTGDRVRVAFDGGESSSPAYWPSRATVWAPPVLPWTTLTLQGTWHPLAGALAPACRLSLTGDYLELRGSVENTALVPYAGMDSWLAKLPTALQYPGMLTSTQTVSSQRRGIDGGPASGWYETDHVTIRVESGTYDVVVVFPYALSFAGWVTLTGGRIDLT